MSTVVTAASRIRAVNGEFVPFRNKEEMAAQLEPALARLRNVPPLPIGDQRARYSLLRLRGCLALERFLALDPQVYNFFRVAGSAVGRDSGLEFRHHGQVLISAKHWVSYHHDEDGTISAETPGLPLARKGTPLHVGFAVELRERNIYLLALRRKQFDYETLDGASLNALWTCHAPDAQVDGTPLIVTLKSGDVEVVNAVGFTDTDLLHGCWHSGAKKNTTAPAAEMPFRTIKSIRALSAIERLNAVKEYIARHHIKGR